MGICLSNQIKAESPFHTGVISSKNVSGNGTELSNPSSKDSSASILPTTWTVGIISSKNVSGNGTELSNPSSKASSASVPQIPRSEGADSSKNVNVNGTELSNPSSKASSASIPQIPRSEVKTIWKSKSISCSSQRCPNSGFLLSFGSDNSRMSRGFTLYRGHETSGGGIAVHFI